MSSARPARLGCAALAAVLAASIALSPAALRAQTDLDALMREVLSKRDENWKKLQQYVLDEREDVELRGPNRAMVWGERREFAWYIRDGFFVRSPVRFNGVSIGEADREKYEADFIRRAKERDARGDAQPAAADQPPADIDALIRQSRQPQFISSAYFLRFRFESGQYAFVGREVVDGRELLRIEYYPTQLFTDRSRDAARKERSPRDHAYDAELRRLMNKVALVTLWIEPGARQIVKYTFDNVGLDFLPVPWLVRVEDVKASMVMGQPFPDVWLPRDLEMNIAVSLAVGRFDLRYALAYSSYRQADVSSRIGIP